MTDVCLISPLGRAPEPRLPLALMYLCASLEQQGEKVRIIDVKSDPHRKLSEATRQKLETRLLSNVESESPLLVGITCLTPEVSEVRDLARKVRERLPETKVVVGGIHPTLYPQDLLYPSSPVDFVVLGEGEETLRELVIALKNAGNWREVMGVSWFEDGQLRRTSPRPLLHNLDLLPRPAYHQVDMEYYTTPTIYTIRRTLISAVHLFTSRGCPQQCTFCVNKNLWRATGSPLTVRYRNPKLIVDEIEYLVREFSIDGFYVYDDTFTVNKRHVFEFCHELEERGLHLIWGTETRVNLVAEDTLRAMARTGCVQIDFGVESGSQEVLDRMNKGITLAQVRNAFALCRRLHIRTFANFMFNTPGETEEDVAKTMALARELDADGYNFNVLTPYPGTDLYDLVRPPLRVEEYGLFWDALDALVDPRFKFARHDLDLARLAASAQASMNPLRKRGRFLLDVRFWKYYLRTHRKRQYLWMLVKLVGVTVRYLVKSTVLARPSRREQGKKSHG